MQLNKNKKNIRNNSPQRLISIVWKSIIIVAVAVATIAIVLSAAYFYYIFATLPKVDRLADYSPPIVSQVFGDDGSLVGEFYLERRTVVPVNKIPKRLIQAFVAAEDSNFYNHKGIDYFGIVRAASKNILSFSKKEGASTITQQVAKSMLLTPEKRFSRKLKEAILAIRMEKKLSKNEILYIYLNQIYLGAGSYGVQVAAETYFGKDIDELNLAEMSMLAGLPKAPSTYSPIKHINKARERQTYVLQRMIIDGYITQAEANHAQNTPIVIRSRKMVNREQSAYFLEQVRIQLEEKYGEERLYKQGLKIYTTMNVEMQKAAFEGVVNGLKTIDKHQGFRGPLQYLLKENVDKFCDKVEKSIDCVSLKQGANYLGVVIGINKTKGEITIRVGNRLGTLSRKNMIWAKKVHLVESYGKPRGKGQSITLGAVVEVQVVIPDINNAEAVFLLDQTPEVQAALIALDPKTGGVKAMVGGYNFQKSQFNRAMQAKRNTGSAFKPIIYSAAIDQGMTTATIIDDSPVEFDNGKWKPKNYDNIYHGPVTLRQALTKSINVASVKILEKIGVGYAMEYARKLGITSKLANNLTMALGSSSVTLIELTSAYSVFASGGYRTTPYFVTKVVDGKGTVLEETLPPLPPPLPLFDSVTSAAFDSATSAVFDPVISTRFDSVILPQEPVKLPEGTRRLESVPVIPPETAYLMTSLMQSVVNNGTAQRAKAVGRPVAGKTGTTNGMKDAWFIGYAPQLVAGVWVGYDKERSLGTGGSGGQAAAPIWTEFMQRALVGMPVQDFYPPANIAFVLINQKTGLLAKEESVDSLLECFVSGTEPTTYDGEEAGNTEWNWPFTFN